jgi:hypothetical protein
VYFLVYQLQQAQDFPTEAICLIRSLEDRDFMLTTLATFISKGSRDGSLYTLVLESDKDKSFIRLTFENNSGLTLRHVLNQDDSMFTELIEKIVAMNEDDYVNVLLLDKINRRQDVLKQLVKFQTQEILVKIPTYFSLPRQDRDDYI